MACRRSRHRSAARAWAAGLLLACALPAAAQPWRHEPPHGARGWSADPADAERQRAREALREQLRRDRGPPGQEGPGDGAGARHRLTPEERQTLREQLREQRRGHGR